MKNRLVLLSNKQKLIELYGKKGVSEIEKAILKWEETLEKENISVKRLYCDRILNGKNKRKRESKLERTIREILLTHYKKKKFEYIFILGDQFVIPYYKLDDPTMDDDSIVSDSPYSSLDNDFLIPEIAVSRLPTLMGRPDFIIKYFKNITKIHKQRRDFINGFGYSAHIWKKASKEVFRRIGNP